MGIPITYVDARAMLRCDGASAPVDTPGVAFAFIRDNAGNCFELIQYKKQ
jgi:hypothetical protein